VLDAIPVKLSRLMTMTSVAASTSVLKLKIVCMRSLSLNFAEIAVSIAYIEC
jgi:hypothetical protein